MAIGWNEKLDSVLEAVEALEEKLAQIDAKIAQLDVKMDCVMALMTTIVGAGSGSSGSSGSSGGAGGTALQFLQVPPPPHPPGAEPLLVIPDPVNAPWVVLEPDGWTTCRMCPLKSGRRAYICGTHGTSAMHVERMKDFFRDREEYRRHYKF